MRFAFIFSVFMSDIFIYFFFALRAPNRIAATSECRNECRFPVLRLGVFACDDGIDSMFSERGRFLH